MTFRSRTIGVCLLVAQATAQPPVQEPTFQLAVLPLAFERTAGEADQFVARGPGYTAWLAPRGPVLALHGDSGEAPRVLRVELLGADSHAVASTPRELAGRTHYLVGNDPEAWRRDVPRFRRIRYRSVLPGVDVVYYGNQRRLEYDLVVAAGRDPERIQLAFSNAQSTEILPNGDLAITSGSAVLTQHAPVIYQDVGGQQVAVSGRYVHRGAKTVGFEIDEYDATRPLIIDPVITIGTYLGGTGSETAAAVARDPSGNVYVAGITSSTNFPGAAQPILGLYDIFVVKMNPTGSQLLYSTVVGGTGVFGEDEWPIGIDVDAQGNAYVYGRTETPDFPTVNAAQSTHGGRVDGFVFKLDPTGSQFVYSTYLGGSDHDADRDNSAVGAGFGGIVVDATGNATIAGSTWSTDFPTVTPMQPQHNGGQADGFITRYDPAGAVSYSTFLGGSGYDEVRDAEWSPQGELLLTGEARSADFPFSPGTYVAEYQFGFAMKFDAVNQTILRSTGYPNSPYCIAADPAGNVYLAGTRGIVPTTLGAFKASPGTVNTPGWVVKMDPDLSSIVYGTYHALFSHESFLDMEVDSAGYAYISGGAGSSTSGGALVIKLNPSGSRFVYSMKFGQVRAFAAALELERSGSVWAVGMTRATQGIATAGALQETAGGSKDGFVIRVDDVPSTVNALDIRDDRQTGSTVGVGSVQLDGTAPAGGVTVTLNSSDPTAAQVPASVTVPPGAGSAPFQISAGKVSGPRDVTITATWNGQVSTTMRVWPGPTYRVVPIVSQGDTNTAWGVNELGDVCGGGQTGLFRYTNAGGLEVLAGFGEGRGINESGQVGGGNGSKAIRYTPGTGVVSLGALQPGRFSLGYDINSAGQVAGFSDVTIGGLSTRRAFRYTDGIGMESLGSLGDTSTAYGINNAGQVVGQTSGPGTAATHAFRYTDGIGMIDLGVLPGYAYSSGWCINDSGQVTGRALNQGTTQSSVFLYTDGLGLTDLGLLAGDVHGAGWGINTFGHVTGFSGQSNSPSAGRATRWTGNGPEEIADRVSSQDAFDWNLTEARAINDRGQIAGEGTYRDNNGRATAFRLDPEFFVPYGRGCEGSLGKVPGLTGTGYPVGGNQVDWLLSGKPQSPAALLIGVAPAQLPLVGCDLLVAPILVAPIATNQAGVASLRVRIPDSVSGPTSLFVQGVVVDSSAANGLISASNGMEVRIPY